jgi:hypothetical protein
MAKQSIAHQPRLDVKAIARDIAEAATSGAEDQRIIVVLNGREQLAAGRRARFPVALAKEMAERGFVLDRDAEESLAPYTFIPASWPKTDPGADGAGKDDSKTVTRIFLQPTAEEKDALLAYHEAHPHATRMHEAGHAVWAYITAEERGVSIEEAVLGVEDLSAGGKWIRTFSSGASGDPKGRAEIGSVNSLSSQALRAESVVALAGPWVAAVCSNLDPRIELRNNSGNRSDLASALMLMHTISPGDPWTEIETAFDRLEREFPDVEEAITAIAEAIPDSGRLDGSECYRLFRAAQRRARR